MHDINFFTHKKSQSKNSTLKVFLIVLFIIVLLINAFLFGGGNYLFKNIKDEILTKQIYIDDPATQQDIKDAEQVKIEVDLTTNYLNLLLSVDKKLNMVDFIDTSLLDHIRKLTPAGIVFTSAQISGININLTCEAKDPTEPMDMYHAFMQSPLFVNVVLSGITINEGNSAFTLNCLVKSEEADQP